MRTLMKKAVPIPTEVGWSGILNGEVAPTRCQTSLKSCSKALSLMCQSHNLGKQWKASWFIGVLEDRAESQLMESRQSCRKMLSPRKNPDRVYMWRRDSSLPVAGCTGYRSCPLWVFSAATLHRDNSDRATCHSTQQWGWCLSGEAALPSTLSHPALCHSSRATGKPHVWHVALLERWKVWFYD